MSSTGLEETHVTVPGQGGFSNQIANTCRKGGPLFKLQNAPSICTAYILKSVAAESVAVLIPNRSIYASSF